jgi:hypothetical protein
MTGKVLPRRDKVRLPRYSLCLAGADEPFIVIARSDNSGHDNSGHDNSGNDSWGNDSWGHDNAGHGRWGKTTGLMLVCHRVRELT